LPIVFRCSRCGYILHVFVKVGQNSYGVPTPSELANQYGGVCPRCGKPLNTKPSLDDIKIYTDRAKVLEVLEEARRTMRISFKSISKALEDLFGTLPGTIAGYEGIEQEA
jgi:DNA-directed RNA polymerase subunit RPC12/RpoP